MSKLQAVIAGALLIDMGYAEDDQDVPPQVQAKVEATAAAVAAALPQNAGLDFLTVMESWTESEANTTAGLIDLVIAATLLRLASDELVGKAMEAGGAKGVLSTTITTTDLRTVLEQYHVERQETESGWSISVQKISEMSSTDG